MLAQGHFKHFRVSTWGNLLIWHNCQHIPVSRDYSKDVILSLLCHILSFAQMLPPKHPKHFRVSTWGNLLIQHNCRQISITNNSLKNLLLSLLCHIL